MLRALPLPLFARTARLIEHAEFPHGGGDVIV